MFRDHPTADFILLRPKIEKRENSRREDIFLRESVRKFLASKMILWGRRWQLTSQKPDGIANFELTGDQDLRSHLVF